MSKNNKKISDALSGLLADTYVLCLKTQNYHWNVEGPFFHSFHALFEGQYNDLFLAGDAIAEQIRTLGEFAPGSYGAFSKLTHLKEEQGVPSANEMVKNLSSDHASMIEKINEMINLTQSCGDEGTTDFLIGRLQIHRKTLWMLKSSLEV